MNKIYRVYQVSDSTGETLDRIFTAIKAQFENFNYYSQQFSFTRTQNQIDNIGEDEIELKNKIIKFRQDELHHKDIAFEEGASKDGFYKVLDGIIKTGSKIAIKISEKY